MRPYTLVRVIVILVFLAWVVSNFIPFAEPPKHVRPTDAAGNETHSPSQQRTQRPTQLVTANEAADILRRDGYRQVKSLKQQPDGAWIATAARSADGPELHLRVATDGQVTQQ
jgi:hypothetical protein